jgi:hypothetical protein
MRELVVVNSVSLDGVTQAPGTGTALAAVRARRGKRLFGEGSPVGALRLVNSRTTSKGVTMATYEPAGPVVTGSFVDDEPAAVHYG